MQVLIEIRNITLKIQSIQPAPSMTLLVYSDPSKTVYSDPPKFSVLERITINHFVRITKLIGVQTNHGVEYFGGPAAPTHQFLYNQRFP